MPRNARPKSEAFQQYDAMTTEELQQILRDDASKPTGAESDMEMLLYVMDVLAKRRQANHEGKTPEEALETFKQEYYTEIDISSDSDRVPAAPKRSGIGRWMKGLIAAAAVFAFVIGGSLTANAMGFDLWGVIAKWTQETFHFGYAAETEETNPPTPSFAQPCASLQEALDNYDIDANLVPTWIPDGYTEVDVQFEETPMQMRFVAKYQSSENTIRIRIVEYLSGAPTQIEQSDSLLEIYSLGGVDYYIINNYDQLEAIWIRDNYECYIMGSLTISELKGIIDSIEEG